VVGKDTGNMVECCVVASLEGGTGDLQEEMTVLTSTFFFFPSTFTASPSEFFIADGDVAF